MIRDVTIKDYKIEVFNDRNDRVVEVMARATHLLVARAAWRVAAEQRPRQRVVLSHGARVIEDTDRAPEPEPRPVSPVR